MKNEIFENSMKLYELRKEQENYKKELEKLYDTTIYYKTDEENLLKDAKKCVLKAISKIPSNYCFEIIEGKRPSDLQDLISIFAISILENNYNITKKAYSTLHHEIFESRKCNEIESIEKYNEEKQVFYKIDVIKSKYSIDFEKLESILTDKQVFILKQLQAGYNMVEIAKIQGTTKQAIYKTIQLIKNKCIKYNLVSEL